MLYKGDFVHCRRLGHLAILHDHLVDVGEDGLIMHSEPASTEASVSLLQSSRSRREIPQGSFFIPTFCDLHLHAPQYLYQGTGLHLPLMEWLDQYAFKAEERIDADPHLAERVYSRLAERLLESGTGAVVLFGTIGEDANIILAKAMLDNGLRAYIGKLSMDISSRPTYKEASAQESLSAAASFSDKCRALSSDIRRPLVEPILTPRFVPTCSDELLIGLGDLAREKHIAVQSHLAEAHDQVQWVLRERGVDDINVFERSGLLTQRTIQAHCTFLPPPSLEKLAHYGTAVAHCPLSNAYFSAEPFRLREALDIGLRVGLGTDVAGGYSIDIMQAMRQAVMISRMRDGERTMRPQYGQVATMSIDWKEALYLATTGGADAMGLQSGIGTFELNSPFDAQHICLIKENTGVGALDLFDTETSGYTLTEELVEKWWCLGSTVNREGVWVQGRSVWPKR